MILDTNTLSAFADDVPAAVVAVSQAERIYLPVVVLGEYRYGIRHAARPREHHEWLAAFLSTCHVLDITQETAAWYAVIRSDLRRIGKPIPANDTWIAALGREHNVPVLSRDRHFDHVPRLRRITW